MSRALSAVRQQLTLYQKLIAGIGVLGGQIGLNALCGTIYPTYMRAMGAGWALGIGRIGAMSGPIIGGYLLAMGLQRPVARLDPSGGLCRFQRLVGLGPGAD